MAAFHLADLGGLLLRYGICAFDQAVPKPAGMARKVNIESWLHHDPVGLDSVLSLTLFVFLDMSGHIRYPRVSTRDGDQGL